MNCVKYTFTKAEGSLNAHHYVLLALLITPVTFGQDLPLQLLKLRPGFSIDIYATPLRGAREMTVGTKGTVFVGTMLDKVYALVPDANSPHGTRVITVAKGLNVPNGVAFFNGALYVAEINRILRFDNIENNLNTPPKPVVISIALPDKVWHGIRFIRFGPMANCTLLLVCPVTCVFTKRYSVWYHHAHES